MQANLSITQVRRHNNPKRKYGYVATGMGKLDQFSANLHDLFVDLVKNHFQHHCVKGKTLLVGLSESGLVPAFCIYKKLKEPLQLRLALSSRDEDQVHQKEDKFVFIEEHISDLPKHFIQIPNDSYDNVILIDDEITSGNTLRNLFLQTKHLSDNFFVYCYADVRRDKNNLIEFAQTHGKNLKQAYLMGTVPGELEVDEMSRVIDVYQPETRVLSGQAESYIFIVGECIVEGLEKYLQSPTTNNLKWITNNNWEVDNQLIKQKIPLGNDANGKCYYYYNPVDKIQSVEIYYYKWLEQVIAKLIDYFTVTYPGVTINKRCVNEISYLSSI